MKQRDAILFSVLFIVLLNMSFASAWIVPESHDYISKTALEKMGDGTDISRTIENNFGDFSACTSITDYSVFLYFTEGFSTIGKTYLASHSGVTVCQRAIELADKSDQRELACAYGICAMSLEDSPSHNGFVPMMVERTHLVNGLVHALSEQCVDNKIPSRKELNLQGRQNLANNYQYHRDYLIQVFASDPRASSIDVPKMMDAFVSEVTQSSKYSVGFRGFTAVPTSIHVFLITIFLICLFFLGKLLIKRKKNLLNKISIWVLAFITFMIVLIYVLYFTGTLWKGFQVLSRPVCAVMPIHGYETYVNQAVNNMVNFFNNGASVMYSIQDPSGLQSLHDADSKNKIILFVVSFLIIAGFSVFLYFNFKKKRK